MDNKQEYDFYKMGVRCANEQIEALEKQAIIIGKMYGKDARLQFESGIADSIPVYETWIENKIDMSEIERGGTLGGVRRGTRK